MAEQNENHGASSKKQLTDAEVLNKVFAFTKLQRSRLDKQLDILHLSKGWRVFLLILLLVNLYILSFFTHLIWIVAVLFPLSLYPFLLYGHFIIPGVMLLNIITSGLFIMRYRRHKKIFFFSCGVFLISLGLFLPAFFSLIAYFAALQTFK
jgi:hypothetical protein